MTDIIMAAGEASGDFLGAALASELKRRQPALKIAGIGGAKMREVGVEMIADCAPLSIMGYWDAIVRLPTILSLREQLLREALRRRPRLFIGIDAPDFNLGVERRLRRAGIRTAHYVSPSIWMWRTNRISTISAAADSVWCLFPFEVACYQNSDVQAIFVGHPQARENPPDKAAARRALDIGADEQLVALMPGSRAAELRLHLPLFADILSRLQDSHRRFIAIAPDDKTASLMRGALKTAMVHVGDAALVLDAADVALIKSGTSALQAAFSETPLVAVYKMSTTAYYFGIWRRFRLPFFTLPNILSGRFVAPELLQHDAQAAAVAKQVMRVLTVPQVRAAQIAAFADIRRQLAVGGAGQAAVAALEML